MSEKQKNNVNSDSGKPESGEFKPSGFPAFCHTPKKAAEHINHFYNEKNQNSLLPTRRRIAETYFKYCLKIMQEEKSFTNANNNWVLFCYLSKGNVADSSMLKNTILMIDKAINQ